MTSSAFICEPCSRARIENFQNARIKMLSKSSKTIMGDALVSGFDTNRPLPQLKFLLLL